MSTTHTPGLTPADFSAGLPGSYKPSLTSADFSADAHDTAEAGTLAALATLFSDLERDAEALRELLRDAEPSALHDVVGNALALLAWRCDFGRKLAGDTGIALATTEERLVPPLVLARAGGAA
jgi:hypothetical protein